MKILIAEQDPELASMIASELKLESDHIEFVHDGRKLQSALTTKPQLVITQWAIAEVFGLDLIRELRAAAPQNEMAILLVSDPLSDESLLQAVEAGMSDYLFKPYERSQLITRVRALKRKCMQSSQGFKDGQYEFGKFRLNTHSCDFYQGDERIHLTQSEFKLLEALFRNSGHILTRDQLIREVQGAGVAVIDRAIDAHVFSLRKKMGESDLIETVRGVGYRVRLPVN